MSEVLGELSGPGQLSAIRGCLLYLLRLNADEEEEGEELVSWE